MDKEKTFRKYLFEEMSPTEMDDFETLLDQDSALREEFKIHQAMFEDRIARMKETLPNKVDHPTKPSSGLKWLIVLIGFALAATIGYYIYQTTKSNEPIPLVAQIESHVQDIYTPPSVKMGEELVGTEAWTKAIEAYRNENYKASKEYLIKIENRTDEQELYLGLSYFYQDPSDPQSALKIFDSIRLDGNNIAKEEALWFSALIQLQQKNTQVAKNILETIVKENTWNFEAAAVLLEKM